MNLEEALSELDKITNLLNRRKTETVKTEDAGAYDELAQIARDEELAREFADNARRFHRSAIAAHDCRPRLRVAAEERRAAQDAISDADDAAAYADVARTVHRK